jgi:hypothetical protein
MFARRPDRRRGKSNLRPDTDGPRLSSQLFPAWCEGVAGRRGLRLDLVLTRVAPTQGVCANMAVRDAWRRSPATIGNEPRPSTVATRLAHIGCATHSARHAGFAFTDKRLHRHRHTLMFCCAIAIKLPVTSVVRTRYCLWPVRERHPASRQWAAGSRFVPASRVHTYAGVATGCHDWRAD